MKKISILTLAVLLIFGFCSLSQATPFFTEGGTNATDGSGLTSSIAGVAVDTFSPNTVGISGSYAIVSGSVSDKYATPYNDTTHYLAAPTPNGIGNGTATITLPGAPNYVGLYWGSVDAYNTLSFYSGTTLVYSLTGSDVLFPANGFQGAGGSVYVNIFDLPPFTRIDVSSTQPAFELDNLAYGTTAAPEPSTLLLLGVGLLGFGLVGLKRRRDA